MLWIIYQEDREGAQQSREATREAHLAYLAEHESVVFLGGALLADDTRRIGSCLIINLPDRASAERWSQNEPFRKAGLFSSVKITRMRKGQYNPAAAPKTAEGE
jgi:uncharacterized protein YciI